VQAPVISKPMCRLSRSERNEETRRRLFAAAARLVGAHGYAEDSVSRVTAKAGVAQGTFYNHSTSRQELLDRLLPTLGEEMLAFIGTRVPRAASDADKEIAHYEPFFAYLQVCQQYQRILNEAEFFAPAAYPELMAMIGRGYLRVLQHARRRGALVAYTDAELGVVVQILIGASAYLSRRNSCTKGAVEMVPEHVLTACAKLVTEGLFRAEKRDAGTPPTPPAASA
jgi:AcrR family transcriptional regulator